MERLAPTASSTLIFPGGGGGVRRLEFGGVSAKQDHFKQKWYLRSTVNLSPSPVLCGGIQRAITLTERSPFWKCLEHFGLERDGALPFDSTREMHHCCFS